MKLAARYQHHVGAEHFQPCAARNKVTVSPIRKVLANLDINEPDFLKQLYAQVKA